MSSVKWTKGKRMLPTNAVWLGVGVMATLLLAFAQAQKSSNSSLQTGKRSAATASTGNALSSSAIVIAQNSAATPAPTIEPDTSASERRPLTFYTGEVRGDLFSAPQPPAPPKPKPVKKVTAPPVPVIVAPVNPFADWAYTGVVTMDDTKMALLENTKTKEGRYVKVGEDFIGAKVGDITDQMVTLQSAGKPYQLAKSDNITVTPLDKSAAFLTATPAQNGQPGQPGQPNPGDNNTMILPNGRTMNGRQFNRRNRFLNNSFNGGGGGGGFGRRFGGGGGFGGGGFGGGGG